MQSEKYAHFTTILHSWGKCDPASTPFIPQKALHVRPPTTSWLPNPRDASQSSSSCLFWRIWTLTTLPYITLSLLGSQNKTWAWRFFSYLKAPRRRQALLFLPALLTLLACLQGDKRSPLCFIPCVHSEETHDIYVLVITSTSRTVFLAYVSVPSLIRSPWTPFFLHFNTYRVLSFIYCAIWFEFAFPPFPLLLPLYRPLSSLPWTMCTHLLLASLLSLVFCLQPTLNTPTSAISKTKRLPWLPFAQGRKFTFLSLILTLGLVSNPASYRPPVVIFPPLVQKG